MSIEKCEYCKGTCGEMVDSGAPDPQGNFIEVWADCESCNGSGIKHDLNNVAHVLFGLGNVESAMVCIAAAKQLAKAQTAVAVVERLKELTKNNLSVTLVHATTIDEYFFSVTRTWTSSPVDVQGPTLETAVLGDGMEGDR